MKFFTHPFLLFSFLLPVALLFFEIPIWSSSILAFLLLMRLFVDLDILSPPPRWLLNAFGLAAFAVTYLQFRTFLGRDASSSLVFILAGLKILEMREPRDLHFVWILVLMLIALNFLFNFDLLYVVLLFISTVFLFLSLLMPVFRRQQVKRSVGLFLRSFLLSLPLTAFLFLFFPRAQSPFVKTQSPQAKTGFSGELAPGKISELTTSETLVFRAALPFRPKAEHLYWVGEYLVRAEDLEWKKLRTQRSEEAPARSRNGLLGYEIQMEPASSFFLFPMRGTRILESDEQVVSHLDGGLFRATSILSNRSVFQGFWSDPNLDTAQVKELSEEEQKSLTQLSPLSEPVQEWIEKFRRDQPTAVVAAVQRILLEQNFQYTLTPGEGSSTLEELIFRGRRGFCEHYAALGATILRRLGIPARIGIGYAGGQYNAQGNFVSVRDRDAHAWIEYFDQGRWRIWDLTQIFAPMSGVQSLQVDDNWLSFRDLWDQIEYFNFMFTRFMVDFNSESQGGFLKTYRGWISAGFAAMVILVFLGMFLLRRRSQLHWLEERMVKLERWADQSGHGRNLNEPRSIYVDRVMEAYPHLKSQLKPLKESYVRWKFYGEPPPSDKKSLPLNLSQGPNP